MKVLRAGPQLGVDAYGVSGFSKQSPATLVLHATAKDSVKLKKPGLVPWLFKCISELRAV